MNFFESPAIAVTEVKGHDQVSTNQINVPLELLFGSALSIFILFFTIIWWVRGTSEKVESGGKRLDDLEKKLETERTEDKKERKELKDDLRVALRADIAQSANDICHGFELFSVEMRAELTKLREGLDARNATVNRLGKQVHHLNNEFIGLTQQLQNNGMSIHYRKTDNGPPSMPFDYDND